MVLLPLWIFNALWLYATCFMKGIAPVDREDHFDDSVDVTNVDVHTTTDTSTQTEVVEVDATTTVETKPENRIFNVFVVLMYILTEVFVCLKLEGSITWHWVALMTPYYLVALMQGNCAAFANVGQVVLIATKLDGTLSWSWNGVFFPYWIGVVVGVVLAPLGVYAATKYSMAQASIDDEQPPSLFWPVVGAISSFVLAVATFSPFLLLMYKLNWGELATVVVFIPYFVVLTLVFLVVLVAGLTSLCRGVKEDNVV
ncbi:hypothetical protein, variant [Aphanomyces invadans]|nr:hypothetical protein, variant [Aphanomyces invadans]ETV98897.1 hypothetical protein, variant [Aphanomyces invadans]|eukprot:XP_008872324.1 hypothetical protein, variant [Aphanomyces invadans]